MHRVSLDGSRSPSLQGQRPARGRRRQGAGSCQADDCSADLSNSSWHERKRICPHHAQAREFLKKERPSRFCQQCSRVHLIEAFEKDRRSCKEQLAKHAARWALELAAARWKTDMPCCSGLCRVRQSGSLDGGAFTPGAANCPKRTERQEPSSAGSRGRQSHAEAMPSSAPLTVWGVQATAARLTRLLIHWKWRRQPA